MDDHSLKRSSLLAYLPEIPKKKRNPREEVVVETESSTVESPQELVISDECQLLDSNQKTKKRKKSKKTKGKRKRKPMLKRAIIKLHPMSDVPRRKIGKMVGGRIVLGIQKQLSYTDVNTGNSRLSIPRSQLISEFLSKDEEMVLDGHAVNSKRKAGINILVIDPRMKEMELNFKKWEMDNACVFNMIHNWNSLVKENGLEAGDTIQVWSFRNEQRRVTKGSDLCFAVVKLEEEEGGDNNGGAEANAANLV